MTTSLYKKVDDPKDTAHFMDQGGTEEIWVVHAFQKKSTQGLKTPQREIELIRDRLKRLKEMLR